MTPHSKEEAVRLANAESKRPDIWSDEDFRANGALIALARYIDRISPEDRAKAKVLAKYCEELAASKYPDTNIGQTNAGYIARLLRLIAGPEEVDPLWKAMCETFGAESVANANKLRAILHNAGYDIVKRESV